MRKRIPGRNQVVDSRGREKGCAMAAAGSGRPWHLGCPWLIWERALLRHGVGKARAGTVLRFSLCFSFHCFGTSQRGSQLLLHACTGWEVLDSEPALGGPAPLWPSAFLATARVVCPPAFLSPGLRTSKFISMRCLWFCLLYSFSCLSVILDIIQAALED